MDYFYQNNEFLNIRIDSYLLDLEAVSRVDRTKKSALSRHRPRIFSSSGQSKSLNRLQSQDSLEQKFTVSKKGVEADHLTTDDETNDQEEADAHITYLKGSDTTAAFKKTARTAFCEISKCVGIAFGSLGVITLGAMYMKK